MHCDSVRPNVFQQSTLYQNYEFELNIKSMLLIFFYLII